MDVCRQSIAFEHMSRLHSCLQRIAEDQDVVVLRVKNRFDPCHDARSTAGYRCVSLNLRIITEETKTLGIDSHVCEIQLQHVLFSQIKVRYENILILMDVKLSIFSHTNTQPKCAE